MFKEMYNYELTLKLWTRMSDNANTNTSAVNIQWEEENVLQKNTTKRLENAK